MSPATTMLATRSTTMLSATTPTLRRRLVTRDHEEHGPGLHLGTRGRADLGDASGRRREQLVLHLHRLERCERSLGLDAIALFHMHGLQQPWHRRAQLDTAGLRSHGPSARSKGALVDDVRAQVVAIQVEAQRIVRDHGDLVALALDRDRPLPSADGLADVRSDDAIVDGEAAALAQLDADAPVLERDLVAHQRSASSRAARAHAGSDTGSVRRSPSERAARTAASAPAAIAPLVSSGTLLGSHCLTKSVSYRPAMKSCS